MVSLCGATGEKGFPIVKPGTGPIIVETVLSTGVTHGDVDYQYETRSVIIPFTRTVVRVSARLLVNPGTWMSW